MQSKIHYKNLYLNIFKSKKLKPLFHSKVFAMNLDVKICSNFDTYQ